MMRSRWPGRLAAGLLALGLPLSAAAAWATDRAVDERSDRRLVALAESLRQRLDRQIMSYAEVLFGLRSLFSLEGEVSESAFQRYVADTGVIQRYPGAVLVGFARGLAPPEPEAQVSDDTFHRAHDRYVLEYVEPERGNEAALGRDLAVDPVRKAAVHSASDSGELVASAPITLHEGGRGFFLSLAVYDTPDVPVTPPARRRHFQGLLIAVFDSERMLAAGADSALLHYDIYDVGLTAHPPPSDLARAEALRGDVAVDFGDTHRGRRVFDVNAGSRRWRVLVTATGPLAVGLERWFAPGVLGAGLLLTVVGSALASAQSRSRRRAEQLAEEMSATARQRGERLQQTNQALVAANARLRAAHEAQVDFLRVISHELQTPLTSILGFSALLGDRQESRGRVADYAARISRNAAMLSRVVGDMVEFTRLETGDVALAVRVERLDQLVARVVDQHALLLQHHRLSLALDRDVEVLADAHAVGRIVTNLLTNATKFSPAGSRIQVRVQRRDGVAELSVEDEGPGVPEHERDRLFEPFYRGSEAGASATPGTGVGLAVVRELAQRMGGQAGVEPGTAGGARFRVALPLACGGVSSGVSG